MSITLEIDHANTHAVVFNILLLIMLVNVMAPLVTTKFTACASHSLIYSKSWYKLVQKQ